MIALLIIVFILLGIAVWMARDILALGAIIASGKELDDVHLDEEAENWFGWEDDPDPNDLAYTYKDVKSAYKAGYKKAKEEFLSIIAEYEEEKNSIRL